MSYLSWNETDATGMEEARISEMYANGYVFTRIKEGAMQQTRSLRVNLSRFSLTSENRRILKKAEGISVGSSSLPVSEYDWKVGKLAKDFYDNKFGPGVMSAQKVKDMLAGPLSKNFNSLLTYSDKEGRTIGYAICHVGKNFIHYSYPFYDMASAPKDMGLAMMTMAIVRAKEQKLEYAYLGSLQRPTDTYKLQFEGMEWFDGGPEGSGKWSADLKAAKQIIAGITGVTENN